MTTKLGRMVKQLNANFRDCLDTEMKKRFGIETVTTFSFFEMSLTTKRVDWKDFTTEELAFVRGYSEGYAAAMLQVEKENK